MSLTEIKRKSLLFTLKSNEVESVIEEARLRKNGYQVHYLIDPFDINKYCFPFGLNQSTSSLKDSNIHLLSDLQIAYDSLFKGDNKPILIEEYQDEIRGFHHAIRQLFTDHVPKLSKQLTQFIDKALKDTNILKAENTLELVKDNLSVIASISIGLANDNLDRYDNLFRKNHLMLESNGQLDLPEIGTEERYDQIFHEILLEFDQIIKSRETKGFYGKKNGSSSNDNEGSSIYKAKENAYHDAMAILRTIALNDFYEKRGEKKIFLYVSSAQWTNSVIKKIQNRFPIVNSEKLDILRTGPQLFANLIFSDPEVNHTIVSLRVFKKLVEKQEKFALSVNDVEKKIAKKFDAQIEGLRNNMENYGILLKHSNLEKELEAALQRLNEPDLASSGLTKITDIIKDVNSYVKEKKDSFEQMFDLIGVSLQQLNFGALLNELIFTDPEAFMRRDYGLDPIESAKQQMPIVFNHLEIENQDLKKLLTGISYFYTQKTPTELQITNFKKELVSGLEKLEANTIDELFISFLVYMAISIPKATENYHLRNFQRAKKVIKMHSSIHAEKDKNYDVALREFQYVLVWSARRARCYAEGLKLSDNFIKLYPQDPRFHHSRALLIYCAITDTDIEPPSSEKDIKLPKISMKDAVKSSEQALSLYIPWRDNGIIEASNSIEALHNTLVHFYSELAYQSLSKATLDPINKAKEHLEHLKKIVGKSYSKYPEYMSSEAYFIYVQFLAHDKLGKIDTSQLKNLKEAQKLNAKCIEKYKKSHASTKYLKRIEFVKELGDKINKLVVTEKV
ncbi:MAG: hypothetical protein ABJO02_16445 [Reichenbachiella sp.]|uniref:hypothetical protein n=1 Tax=Reichenbachiella sp. TaxID=2184521 RepID=UPI003297EEB4